MNPRVLLSGALAAAVSFPAAAVTYQVNSTGDAPDANTGDGVCETAAPGVCTLRAAVDQANVTGGTILVPAGTITLQNGFLVLAHDLSIVGAGAKRTIVDGAGLYRIFGVTNNVTVSISDLTMRNAVSSGDGGAVVANPNSHLTLARTVLTHNYSPHGGAVACSGFLTITDSDLYDNHAPTPTGTAGGAVYAGNCALTISGTTLHDNSAGIGGAVVLLSGPGTLSNSTFGGNTADTDGGAVYVASQSGHTLGVWSCTFSDNHALNGNGGGIYVGDSFTVQLHDSILGFNWHGAELMQTNDCSGPVSSDGYNIIYFKGNTCTVTGAYSTADPLLGPLQDNGGRAPTFALLSGSPAIDAGTLGPCPATSSTFLATDERGVDRVLGARCDLGAYERAPCGDANGDGVVDVSDVFFVINSLFAGGAIPPGLANVNGDSSVTVSDVFYLINRLFAGGAAPNCPGT
jgi:CSLREA domain-containing protein